MFATRNFDSTIVSNSKLVRERCVSAHLWYSTILFVGYFVCVREGVIRRLWAAQMPLFPISMRVQWGTELRQAVVVELLWHNSYAARAALKSKWSDAPSYICLNNHHIIIIIQIIYIINTCICIYTYIYHKYHMHHIYIIYIIYIIYETLRWYIRNSDHSWLLSLVHLQLPMDCCRQ